MTHRHVMILMCTLMSAQLWAADASFVVETKSGQLRGVPRSSGGAEFLGVRYAQPPVGDLRWREPIPAKSWDGVRDATAFGAPCSQPDLGDWNRHDAERGEEDCLFLNVITPVWPPKQHLPVMFWIHGGANAGGTASAALYKDGTLPQHGVILVTANYRLGVLGFLAHPGLTQESAHHTSGNYGLMDQILALRWVRDNIAKFGGDPGNITVFGQSAGAQDTSLLMTSPLSKDMFQRAIAESGSAMIAEMPSLAEAEQEGQQFAEKCKSPADNTIAYLRHLPPNDVIKAAGAQRPGPIVDGWVLRQSPAGVFKSGDESAIPMLLGNTTREFNLPQSGEQLRATIRKAAGDSADQVLGAYGLANGGEGKTDPLYGPVGNQWLSDLIFRCPASTQAIWHESAHHRTFRYQFDRAIPGQEAEGAVHSADLPYVFGYYPKTGNISGAFGDVDYKLADIIETYWTNFAKTGDPNGAGVPKWPEFDGSRSYIEFTTDGGVMAKSGDVRSAQCDVHREVLERRMKGIH